MRVFSVFLALILALPAVAADPLKVALLDLDPASEKHAATAKLATAALAEGLGALGTLQVVSSQEVSKQLDLAAQQSLMGCEDERCILDLKDQLAVDRVVIGQVGEQGGKILVFAAILSPKEARTLARTSAVVGSAKQLAPSLKKLARRLTDPDGPGGDEPLTRMRLGVLFDEFDANGKSIGRRPTEACVNKALIDKGATLVSVAARKAIKGKAGPREILEGGVPDGITPEDADALLVGTVDYALNAERGRIKNFRGDLSLQLVTVASGEIIASETVDKVAPGYSEGMAAKKIAKNLCKAVGPALETALARRIERGRRVVLELEGVKDPAQIEALVDKLRKMPRVGKALLRVVVKDKAQIDLWLKGGDGVRFALGLDDGVGLTPVEISSEKVRAKL
jgi:hypothetical protein